MNGITRFLMLLASCILVLILWPFYTKSGLGFMGIFILVWTCLIVLFSVLINLFAIYKWEIVHRILSVIFVVLMLSSLVCYFPLEGEETPFSRLKDNRWPSVQDIKKGIQRLTFNFDFERRNVHRDANYINQKFEEGTSTSKEVQKVLKKQQKALDNVVEKLKSEESK